MQLLPSRWRFDKWLRLIGYTDMADSSSLLPIFLISFVLFIIIKYCLGMKEQFEFQDRFDNNVTHYVFQELYNVLVDRAPYR